MQELELDEPTGHEVLVRLVACGVCHTDLYTASGVDPSGYAPCVLGHEGAGVVERVGADVTLVAPGDRVGAAGAGEGAGRDGGPARAEDTVEWILDGIVP